MIHWVQKNTECGMDRRAPPVHRWSTPHTPRCAVWAWLLDRWNVARLLLCRALRSPSSTDRRQDCRDAVGRQTGMGLFVIRVHFQAS